MAQEMKVEGLDQVTKALKGISRRLDEELDTALVNAGRSIVGQATRNLNANSSWVTGHLANLGGVQRADDGTVDAGFFELGETRGYADVVEYGRRAGRMPPPDALAAWAYKKFQLRDLREAFARAWAMAKTIARNGTRPHPYLTPAMENGKYELEREVRNAIRRATE